MAAVFDVSEPPYSMLECVLEVKKLLLVVREIESFGCAKFSPGELHHELHPQLLAPS